ncbi:SDR family NAD(P)-dependent oxidoreductase [Mycolicibacterium holsaticum]|uniref:3-oxoacyl-[acyl-carrier-protein] reductase MabA n=1 Tax=Mycolicibacterium holsaticum TaxID=152142 RepID=A0A1E3RWT1_9MYCO|nr:SDR family oxidoreductase [Mycolicibacterium holsaticum]ODQ94310.1 3-hydroxyacyl-CoA dehydrogenase [Mycolicibacterium holsaticum]
MSSSSPVALVTGAGSGIGREVAIHLSAKGHRVALTARNVEQLQETASRCGPETTIVAADITDQGAIDALFTHIEDRWGSVDVLVANAGAGTSAPLHKTTDDQWRSMLEVNLTAPFRCIRRAVPGMVAGGYGRIVAVASVAAKRGEPYVSAYTSSKHGLLGLVRSAAAELATTGVTANAVCPGYVDTPMTQRTIAEIAKVAGRTAADARAALEAKQLNRRLVRIDEVRDAVWFCISNAALNGQSIAIDGGAIQV